LNTIGSDPSVIDPDERSELTKWGGMNQLSMMGIFATIFLPAGLLLAKTMERQKKLMYLKYGMGFQVVVGSIFLFSSFKLSNLVKDLDERYFQHLGIDQIKEYNPNMWNTNTPPAYSAGNVLANMNRQPYGGNTQYYQPQNPVFTQQNHQVNTQPAQNNNTVPNNNESSAKE
jgi:hypothetical protein